jgi:hypothetical protein
MYSSPYRRFAGMLKRELFYWLDGVNRRRCARLAASYNLPGGYKRIYHYHIRKTGGTSINTMFLSLWGGDGQSRYRELNTSRNNRIIINDKVFVGWNPKMIDEGHYLYAFSHLPAHQLNLPSNTFTFTCLRDPIRRLTSLYNMLHEQQQEGGIHPGFKSQKPYLRDSFYDFVLSIPKEERFNQLFMFSKKFDIDEAVRYIKNCNVYFFSDAFNEGIEKISKELDINLTPIHLRAGRHYETIDLQMIEELKKLLEPEYRLIDQLR